MKSREAGAAVAIGGALWLMGRKERGGARPDEQAGKKGAGICHGAGIDG